MVVGSQCPTTIAEHRWCQLLLVSKQHLQNSQANKKERQLASTTVANVFLGLLCFSLSNFSFTTIQLNNRGESLSLANRLVMQ